MDTPDDITPRQQEVLERIEQDIAPKEIADELGISVSGIYAHKRRLIEAGKLTANGNPKRGRRAAATNGNGHASSNGSSENARSAAIEAITKLAGEAREIADDRLAEIEERRDVINAEADLLTAEDKRLEQEAQSLTAAREAIPA